MKKESFATSKRYRFKTKGLAKEIKFLKKLRRRKDINLKEMRSRKKDFIAPNF
jgi:hypothetical protein